MTGCLAKWKDNFYPHGLYAFACRLLSPSLTHNLKGEKQKKQVLLHYAYLHAVAGADFGMHLCTVLIVQCTVLEGSSNI